MFGARSRQSLISEDDFLVHIVRICITNDTSQERSVRVQGLASLQLTTYLKYPDLLAVALFDPGRRLKPPEGYLRSGITAHILEGRSPLRWHTFLPFYTLF